MRNTEQLPGIGAAPEEPAVQGQYASAEDVFYTEWGGEIIKGNLRLLNEVLRQLLTASIALMSGSIAFLTDQMISWPLKLVAVIMFMLALAFALVGVLPYSNTTYRNCAEDVRRSTNSALKWKNGWLRACIVMLALGLIGAAVGVLVK